MKYTLKNVRRNLVSLRKGTLYTRRWVSNQVSDPRGPENAHAATTLLPSLGIPLPAPRWPGPYTVQKLRSSKVTHLLSRTLTAGRICDSSSSKSSKIHNTGLRPGQSPKLNKERYLQEHFNPALLKKKKFEICGHEEFFFSINFWTVYIMQKLHINFAIVFIILKFKYFVTFTSKVRYRYLMLFSLKDRDINITKWEIYDNDHKMGKRTYCHLHGFKRNNIISIYQMLWHSHSFTLYINFHK